MRTIKWKNSWQYLQYYCLFPFPPFLKRRTNEAINDLGNRKVFACSVVYACVYIHTYLHRDIYIYIYIYIYIPIFPKQWEREGMRELQRTSIYLHIYVRRRIFPSTIRMRKYLCISHTIQRPKICWSIPMRESTCVFLCASIQQSNDTLTRLVPVNGLLNLKAQSLNCNITIVMWFYAEVKRKILI